MLFMSAPQLKALGKLTESVEMQSFTVENSPDKANVIRVTMWDKDGHHAKLDVDEYGHAKKVENIVV